jgi:hypothetical protein
MRACLPLRRPLRPAAGVLVVCAAVIGAVARPVAAQPDAAEPSLRSSAPAFHSVATAAPAARRSGWQVTLEPRRDALREDVAPRAFRLAFEDDRTEAPAAALRVPLEGEASLSLRPRRGGVAVTYRARF